jgi:hypothetical protein
MHMQMFTHAFPIAFKQNTFVHHKYNHLHQVERSSHVRWITEVYGSVNSVFHVEDAEIDAPENLNVIMPIRGVWKIAEYHDSQVLKKEVENGIEKLKPFHRK